MSKMRPKADNYPDEVTVTEDTVMRRIAACLEFCEDMSTEELELMVRVRKANRRAVEEAESDAKHTPRKHK